MTDISDKSMDVVYLSSNTTNTPATFEPSGCMSHERTSSMTNPQYTSAFPTIQNPKNKIAKYVTRCWKECDDCPLYDPGRACHICGSTCKDVASNIMVTSINVDNNAQTVFVMCGDCIAELRRATVPPSATSAYDFWKNGGFQFTNHRSVLNQRSNVMNRTLPPRELPFRPRINKRTTKQDKRVIKQDKNKKEYIYFIRGKIIDAIKIGFTTNVEKRVYSIGCTTPGGVDLLAVIPGTIKMESDLHERFDQFAIGHEWFTPDPAIIEYIESLGEHAISR